MLVTFFMVGAVVGSFFAANISGAGQSYVARFLTGTALAGRSGVLQVAGWELGLLLTVFLSAFFWFGFLLAPLAFGVKGFMLSMLTSAFVKTFGARGYAVSLALIVLGGFVSVTCLSLVGMQAAGIARARARSGRRGRVYIDRAYYFTAALCAVLSLLAAVLYCYVTPVVGRMVSAIG